MSVLLRLVVVCLILFSVFVVFISTPQEEQFARAADEGYYFLYAKTVKDLGVAAFPALLQHHFKDKVAQLYPHPGRVGHTLMTALWFKFFPETFVSLARFSLLCFVLFLWVSFYYCRKFFGSETAYLYTLLLSSNPLFMTAARRALQDSYLNLFWALCLWLFLDFLIHGKKSTFILFLAAFSMSLMIKEASLVLIVFFIFAFLLYKYRYKQKLSYDYLCGMILVPFFLVGIINVVLLGGAGNLLTLYKFIFFGLHLTNVISNPYVLYAMGPWYKFIMDFLMITPLTTLLAIGYFGYMFFSRRFEAKTVYFLSYLLIIYTIFAVLKYTKIVRFVVSLEIAMTLLAVMALHELFRQKNKRLQTYLIFTAATIIYFVNYHNFVFLFLKLAIYDSISYWLLMAHRIIPGLGNL